MVTFLAFQRHTFLLINDFLRSNELQSATCFHVSSTIINEVMMAGAIKSIWDRRTIGEHNSNVVNEYVSQ